MCDPHLYIIYTTGGVSVEGMLRQHGGESVSTTPRLPLQTSDRYQTLISTSTPEGSSSFIRASIVLGVEL